MKWKTNRLKLSVTITSIVIAAVESARKTGHYYFILEIKKKT